MQIIYTNLHQKTIFLKNKWENSGNFCIFKNLYSSDMKINFRLKNTKKNPSSIYVRFFDSKNNERVDVEISTGFSINPADWNGKKQTFKPNANRGNNVQIAVRIDTLKNEIISNANLEYSNGGIVNRQFLKKIIDKSNNRPSQTLGVNDPSVYFKNTIKEYTDYYTTHISPDSNDFLKPNTIKKYNTLRNAIIEFETKNKVDIKLIDIDMTFHSQFISFHKDKNHSDSTINKDIRNIKAVLRFAENKKQYKVHNAYKDRDFTFKLSQTYDTYLNYDEIELITNLIIEDEKLGKFRDFFVLNLWFGCRVSDMQKITSANIEYGNTISIPAMIKTGKKVKIPISKSVKKILDKRNGKFPFEDEMLNASFAVEYNEVIKKICRLATITGKIYGGRRIGENGTLVYGNYEKCDLITSKTCRKSFATNLYKSGKLPKETIMSITGHSDIKSFDAYVVDNANDNLESVRKYFDEQF